MYIYIYYMCMRTYHMYTHWYILLCDIRVYIVWPTHGSSSQGIPRWVLRHHNLSELGQRCTSAWSKQDLSSCRRSMDSGRGDLLVNAMNNVIINLVCVSSSNIRLTMISDLLITIFLIRILILIPPSLLSSTSRCVAVFPHQAYQTCMDRNWVHSCAFHQKLLVEYPEMS